jgi:hypothetical protein
MTLVNLDSIGPEEFARLFREACKAAGISSATQTWEEIGESRRAVHRTAAEHLRAALNARLAEPAVRRLADLTVRD